MRVDAVQPRLRQCAFVVLMLSLDVGLARAQCDITGPSTFCGDSAQLCGPGGPFRYEWKNSSGIKIGDQECLTITAPGTYSLRAFDFINGLWFGPCTFTIAQGQTPGAPAVTGGGTVCQGSSAELCGPADQAEYLWSGPDSFTAATSCVTVSTAGIYQLQVRGAPDACWSAPGQQTVSFEACGGTNCPLPPVAWSRQCRSRHSHRGPDSGSELADLAKCVDERSRSFLWRDPAEGLCRTLENCRTPLDRAHRQFAGVLLNVCTHDRDLTARVASARGIAPKTLVSLKEFTGSVESWIASADARLGELDRRPLHDRRAKENIESIIRVGWQINHGLGIGAVCSQAHSLSMNGAANEGDAALADQSLAEELRDTDPALALETLSPNPTNGPAHVSYVVSAATSDENLLGVYDVSGRMVRELDRGVRAPGRYEATWDGRDSQGRVMRNGAYFVIGRVGSQRIAGRLVLLH